MRTTKQFLYMLRYDPALINSLTTFEAFNWARNKICQGHHTDAVKMICDAIVFELQNNAALSAAKAAGRSLKDSINTKNWPQLGAVLAVENDTPKVHYTKESFKPSEAVSYYNYFQQLVAQLTELRDSNDKSIKAYWRKLRFRARERVSEWIIGLVPVDIEDPWSRRYANLLVDARFLFGLEHDRLRSRRDVDLIGHVFREPVRNAKRIHKDYTKHMIAFRSNDWRTKNVDGYLEQYVDSVVWEDEAGYKSLLEQHRGKSRVLTTLHFGLFRNSLLRLGKHVEEGRTNITVTQYEDSYEQRRARNRFYEGIKEDYLQYTSDQLDSRMLVKELRKGNTAVTLLFDMPAKSGESIDVQFLGRRARFAKGTAHIAITARVPIFPVFTFVENGASHLVCREVIDTTLLPDESLDDAVRRVTQILVRMAEEYILKYPHQWMLLNRLESYFVGENGIVPEDV